MKPICFEGLRKLGTPQDLALRYYNDGADEILYIDIVSSLYKREIILDQIKSTADKLFIPFAVGGGVQSIENCAMLLRNGVDKIVINTYALQEDPTIINKASKIFGSQAIVVHIQAKKWDDWWECYSDCGRIRSGRNVLDWAKEVENRGAGEIIVSSVDRDGTKKGFDIELIKAVVSSVKIPVVAGSGAGKLEDIKEVAVEAEPSAIAIGSLLHYNISSIREIKEYLIKNHIQVSS